MQGKFPPASQRIFSPVSRLARTTLTAPVDKVLWIAHDAKPALESMKSWRAPQDSYKLLDWASAAMAASGRITRSRSRFASSGDSDGRMMVGTAAATTADIEDGAEPPAKRPRPRPSQSEAVANETANGQSGGRGHAKVPSLPPPRRRARKPGRTAAEAVAGPGATSPPPDWQEMYDMVKKMRSPGGIAHGAAVDTMGCERLADGEASPRLRRYHTLVALMLSSQTKDTVNAAAMHRLKTELPPHKPGAPAGLNLDNMLAVDAKLLNELIWAVGFHNNKTKYLKQVASILREKWKDDIPDSIEGLTSLPGVGPKMAYLCMSVAWDRTEGIGVDVHVHRITNLWGWHKTKTPEETRLALQSWLPRDKWREINWLLVGFGQAVCLPVGRRCGTCDLGTEGLCKAAVRGKALGTR